MGEYMTDGMTNACSYMPWIPGCVAVATVVEPEPPPPQPVLSPETSTADGDLATVALMGFAVLVVLWVVISAVKQGLQFVDWALWAVSWAIQIYAGLAIVGGVTYGVYRCGTAPAVCGAVAHWATGRVNGWWGAVLDWAWALLTRAGIM